MFLNGLLFLFILMTLALAKAQRDAFHCDSSEDVRDFGIKQVITVNEDVYLFNGNQFIFFKGPFCFFNAEKQTICAISQAFKVDTKFKSKMDDSKFELRG